MAGTIKFFDEMQNASNVSGQDKMMIGKAENGETQVITFDQAKQYLDITSNEIAPIVGGDSEENATPVPAGPAGQTRRADVAPGWVDFGSGPIEASSTNRWMAYWDGISWSLVDMGELPQTDVSGLVDKKDMASENLFSTDLLVGMNISTSNTIQINSNAASFYLPVKTAEKFILYRPTALSDRFIYGFTAEIPSAGVPVTGVTSTNMKEYFDITAPIDGYIIVYLSSPTDDAPDFRNIVFSRYYSGSEYATKEEINAFAGSTITYDNLFSDLGLRSLVLNISNNVVESVEGRSFYYPIAVGDVLDLYRPEALSNRFTYGFTTVEPTNGVPVVNIVNDSMTEYRGIEAPFDGYIFIYLSNGADAGDRSFSNIVLNNRTQLKPIDNLNSNDENRPLSANQGNVLKTLIENSGVAVSSSYVFGRLNELYSSPEMPDVSPGQSVDLTLMPFSELYTLWDELVSDHPNKLTKSLIGYGADSDNNPDSALPIYEYTLSPEETQPRQVDNGGYLSEPPVVAIGCGLHGDEKLAPWVLYHFVKEMLEGTLNESIETLLNNYTIKLVPLFNPHGLSGNSRPNINGIDLNRNFASATPQQETIVAKDWAYANRDAVLFIDFHNNYYSQAGCAYYITDNTKEARAISSMFRRVSPTWKTKYFPSQNDQFARGHVRSLATVNGYNNTFLHYISHELGVKSSGILEFTKSWTDNVTWYKSEPSEVGMETLGNALLSILDSKSK